MVTSMLEMAFVYALHPHGQNGLNQQSPAWVTVTITRERALSITPNMVTSRKVLTAYEHPTKSKEISVEDMQKIMDANEKLVKELKDGDNRVFREL